MESEEEEEDEEEEKEMERIAGKEVKWHLGLVGGRRGGINSTFQQGSVSPVFPAPLSPCGAIG